MVRLSSLLKKGLADTSDFHFAVGAHPMMRVAGRLKRCGEELITDDQMRAFLNEIIPREKRSEMYAKGIDLSLEFDGASFRTNVYQDRRGVAVALRVIPRAVRTLSELGLPEVVQEIAYKKRGLVLVSGIAGSGKTTTLAALIDKINRERAAHIITIEDPIEYLHENKNSLINQREVGTHATSFADALRAALREDPDVIMLGEMRDLETIATAITAAETGHLVLGSIHTRGASQTVDRMIDVFSADQQDQIRAQLADALEMVVSQVLVPSKDGTRRYLAYEIMTATYAIKSLIRDKKTYQIPSTIETGKSVGMQMLDKSLISLVEGNFVTMQDVQPWILDKDLIRK